MDNKYKFNFRSNVLKPNFFCNIFKNTHLWDYILYVLLPIKIVNFE
jgi:hypothetical protein